MENKFRKMNDKAKYHLEQLMMELHITSYSEGFEAGKTFGQYEDAISVKPALVKSPNQQRVELIRKAKKFVEERQNTHHHTNFVFVNKGHRVTCLIKGNGSGKILRIGRSNCNPTDVFNLYIGQVISLAKALKIDVPVEFLESVQPSEVVVGMAIRNEKEFMEAASGPIGIGELFIVVENENSPKDGECQPNSGVANSATITDDTNAKYGELDD